MKIKIIISMLLGILILIGNLFAQLSDAETPIPTNNSDSCRKSYTIQLDSLINEYFNRDVIRELTQINKKIYVSLTPTIKDTFSIKIQLRRSDSTLFTKDEISGLEKYIKQKGKFQYCFMVDGCGGIIEEGKEPTKPTAEEIQNLRNKLYGQHIQWTIPIPY